MVCMSVCAADGSVYVSVYSWWQCVCLCVQLVAVCTLIWWFNPKQRALHVMAAGAYVLAMGNVLFMIALSCMGTAEGGYSAFSLLADMGGGGGG